MYQKMYLTLFNAITDSLALMEQQQYHSAALLLCEAQCRTEELYITGADTEDSLFGSAPEP